ncbi:hypothetical protein [Rhodococcus sp. NPDC058639]|uniref:hypothetical protein n=1 Tax=unclassified Rhodococcus (in: high G+C Gram-positive bacteria) TaxID=192944 RepID=UPI003650DBAB
MAESERPGTPADNDDLTGEKISRLVDDMEERVEAEHEREGKAGSRSDREETEAVEPDDQAPE